MTTTPAAARPPFPAEERRTAQLAARLDGPLLLPGGTEYEAVCAGFNRCDRQRPALVVVAHGPDDVVTAVRYAAEHGLPVAVQATGHGPNTPADGALLISTARMDGFDIDPAARTVRMEAGVRWRQVLDGAAPFGLAPLCGSSPLVGAVSYTLGGGLGLMSRKYGFAADHVSAMDVVTADGELRHVTEERHPDLFWALRGGKGNFGVVVSMESALVPVSRLYGGALVFDGAHCAEVLHAWRAWTREVPEETTSSVALIRFPEWPELPEVLRGRFVVWVRVAHLDRETEGEAEGDPDGSGERLVEPLRRVAPTLLDTVCDMPFTESGTIHSDPEAPGPWHERTALLDRLDEETVDALLARAGAESGSGLMVVELRQMGGALARPPAVPSAVSHRDAAFTVFALKPAAPEEAAETGAELEGLMDALDPWATGGKFVNFMTGSYAGGAAEDAYDPAAYRRLTALKSLYDPGNVFRFNVNIPPRATGG